jgi:hypothetical protein
MHSCSAKSSEKQKAKSGIGSSGNSDAERAATAKKTVAAELDVAWNSFVTKCKQVGWDLSVSELRTKGYEIDIQR